MIRVLFFAGVRERLGVDMIDVDAAAAGDDVMSLRALLTAKGDVWAGELGLDARILVAINQEMTAMHSTIADGDEIAFFPPVTGG